MSYIDTRDHSYVGKFLGLPLYHPLQEYPTDDEFYANVSNLVLGGGSGEHPALVIKNPAACVLAYVEFSAQLLGINYEEKNWFKSWEKVFDNDKTYNIYDNLCYENWSMEQVTRLTESIEAAIQCYRGDGKIMLGLEPETKFHIMLGEFIFFSAQKLLAPEICVCLTELQDDLKNQNMYLPVLFEAVIVPAQGYPVSGRKTVDNKVIWSMRFDAEEENQHEPELARKTLLNYIKKHLPVSFSPAPDEHWVIDQSGIVNTQADRTFDMNELKLNDLSQAATMIEQNLNQIKKLKIK